MNDKFPDEQTPFLERQWSYKMNYWFFRFINYVWAFIAVFNLVTKPAVGPVVGLVLVVVAEYLNVKVRQERPWRQAAGFMLLAFVVSFAGLLATRFIR
ncbi:hypothetical protein D5S17_27335 [Pseudonocardiaceae bacterium YIM PH 21723]|nr:hypothetical protein D5S17_27335 [Pseudonocardiaceae bacterium YIM PH 21723]